MRRVCWLRELLPLNGKELRTPISPPFAVDATLQVLDVEGRPATPSALVAFRQIIDILCSDECMLAFPDPNKHDFLSVDAALGDMAQEGGLGAILTQQADNGQERIVSYWS